MKPLVLESFLLLLYFDFVMGLRGFRSLHEGVRRCRLRPARVEDAQPSAALCDALDLACVFYFRPVMCLQRSAATTVLLRRHGWQADLVIGAQILPAKYHAWVEIERVVVNDRPYVTEIYRVLERC